MKFRRRGNKKSSPFLSALFGLGFFFGSFVMLYLNEGRVDLSKIAKESFPVSAATIDADNQGALVAAAGVLHTDELLGDPELLTTSEYLQLDRLAEMYAWEESEDEDDEGFTSYDYSRRWTSDPENSNNFNSPNGHFNPPMKYREQTFTVSAATIGAFRVDPGELFFMEKEEVPLREGMLLQGRMLENYIYIGEGSLEDPEIGDLRISYAAFLNDQSATLFGKQDEGELGPYIHKNDTTLYRAYPSDRETAIASMRTEYLTWLWGFRAGGFVLMWLGMMMVASPLTTLLGYIPILGNAGRLAIAAFALAVALVLSTITIIVSAILHSPVALITILLLFIVGGLFLWRQQGKRA